MLISDHLSSKVPLFYLVDQFQRLRNKSLKKSSFFWEILRRQNFLLRLSDLCEIKSLFLLICIYYLTKKTLILFEPFLAQIYLLDKIYKDKDCLTSSKSKVENIILDICKRSISKIQICKTRKCLIIFASDPLCRRSDASFQLRPHHGRNFQISSKIIF